MMGAPFIYTMCVYDIATVAIVRAQASSVYEGPIKQNQSWYTHIFFL